MTDAEYDPSTTDRGDDDIELFACALGVPCKKIPRGCNKDEKKKKNN